MIVFTCFELLNFLFSHIEIIFRQLFNLKIFYFLTQYTNLNCSIKNKCECRTEHKNGKWGFYSLLPFSKDSYRYKYGIFS